MSVVEQVATKSEIAEEEVGEKTNNATESQITKDIDEMIDSELSTKSEADFDDLSISTDSNIKIQQDGSMLSNAVTPDGYNIGADGKMITAK